MGRYTKIVAAVVALAGAGPAAWGGTYANITIDGSYGDWAAVPVLDDDSGDNSGGPDIGITKIANDDNYLYIYNSFPNSLSIGVFTSIDVDNNAATGFNIFGLGLVGAEAGWQNDFPFASSTGVFNNGQGMSGDFFGSGAANLDKFNNSSERELAISLDILFNQSGQKVFANSTFTLMFWTDQGLGADGIPAGLSGDSGLNGDVSAPIVYTLAGAPTDPPTPPTVIVPSPAAASAGVLLLTGLLLRRRRV